MKLQNNAYNVLGLDTSASQKDIAHRSKEILTRLKIDDIPKYDTDVLIFKNFRTEQSVKHAVSTLSTPKKHIEDYFFWFQASDSVDDQALGLLRQGNYDEAVRIWDEHSASPSVKALLYKKNLALLYTLLLFVENNKSYLDKSVALWNEIIKSDRFWNSFSKVYKLHDDLGADNTVMDDFRQHIAASLGDIYTELSSHYKDNIFAATFSKNFGLKGKKLETDVLGPIYKVLNDAVEKIESMKVSADGTLDAQETLEIKNQVDILQTEFNKLIELGLYDDSQIQGLRDRAASSLRQLSIDLENNLNQTEVALGIAKIAGQISGGAGIKGQMRQDVQTLETNRLIKPVMNEIKAGNLDRALTLINKCLSDSETPQDVLTFLQDLKNKIETRSTGDSDNIWSTILSSWWFWIILIWIISAMFE